MSGRTSREDRERLQALVGGDAVDTRDERTVHAATYAADGVCSGPCGTDADDAPEAFVGGALVAVEEWLARNEPIERRAFDDLRSRFAREPGVSAVPRKGHDTGAVHLREVMAEEIGMWVANADVATPTGLGRDALAVYYTANVRVARGDSRLVVVAHGGTTPLPAPDVLDAAEATAGPPE